MRNGFFFFKGTKTCVKNCITMYMCVKCCFWLMFGIYFIAYFKKFGKHQRHKLQRQLFVSFISSMCSRSLCHLEKCHLSNKLFAIKRAVKHKYQVLTVFYGDTSSRRDFRFSNKKWMLFLIVKFALLFFR